MSVPLMEVLEMSQQFCRGRGTLASPRQAGVRPRKWTEQPERRGYVAGRTEWLEGGVLGRKKAASVGSGARWDGLRGTDSILQAVEGLQEWGLEAMSFPGSAWGETVSLGRYQRLGLMEGAPGGHFSQCCILSEVLCTVFVFKAWTDWLSGHR